MRRMLQVQEAAVAVIVSIMAARKASGNTCIEQRA
jgi:hypothetical protein